MPKNKKVSSVAVHRNVSGNCGMEILNALNSEKHAKGCVIQTVVLLAEKHTEGLFEGCGNSVGIKYKMCVQQTCRTLGQAE